MFKDAGPGFQVDFDYATKLVLVRKNFNPFVGGPPCWTRPVSFSTPEQWEASEFARQVSEAMSDAIVWFWIDISAKAR